MDRCHWCGGSGKDEDAERAASPDRCPYCRGTGREPEDDDGEVDDCPICYGTGRGELLDWHCPACFGTGKK